MVKLKRKLLVFVINLIQVVKVPLYVIPYDYGRLIYGEGSSGALYIWRNQFFQKMLGLYYKVDKFQVRFGRILLWQEKR